jgi:endonuclease/exonuclease/phosphatase family metal-dependent hydrolase
MSKLLWFLGMTRFLFWNLGKQPLQKSISRLASLHEIDVIILVECQIPPATMLWGLNENQSSLYDYAPGIGCERVKLFTKFHRDLIPPIYEEDRLTIRRLQLPGLQDILVTAVHFPSKLFWSDESQAAECARLSQVIKRIEAQTGHKRSILVGDLNMDPFEAGVVNANGIHATMSRQIASRGERVVQGQSYPFFYNPMWNLFGDMSTTSPGTFYYSSSEHKAYFWHMFDQVLIRPDLQDNFPGASLRILVSDGVESFVNENGLPDHRTKSDHLPLMFDLVLD